MCAVLPSGPAAARARRRRSRLSGWRPQGSEAASNSFLLLVWLSATVATFVPFLVESFRRSCRAGLTSRPTSFSERRFAAHFLERGAFEPGSERQAFGRGTLAHAPV